MIISTLAFTLGLSTLAAAAPTASNFTADFPTIDLGYAVHRASSYNETYDSYTFSNIRFAAPPTGSLRFAPPQAPLENRTVIQDGSIGYTCPQAEPSYADSDQTTKAGVSEDCLFLDVIVPRKVLEGDYGEVPVLVWLFGGGYVLGSKTQHGDPINFLTESPSPVVYVAPNYRLGAFGFLAGPTFTLEENTTPNAGLYDQRFALKWVQDNIHLFNGAKDEVTVMGGSAGAGSLMHHISAYGGTGEVLFKRAIPIGPGFSPTSGHSRAETAYLSLQNATGCIDQGIDCLRAVSTEDMQLINRELIRNAEFTFGPAIDGNLVPDIPSYLFAQGRFQQNLSILVADDIDEGSSFVGNTTSISTGTITTMFPGITAATLAELLALYPPPSDSTPYKTEHDRLVKVMGDVGFDCNRYAFSAAMPDTTYNLVTAIEPGTHGTWSVLLFNEVDGSDAVVDRDILLATRRFIMNFVVGGTPNELSASQGGDETGVGPEQIQWPVFGSDGQGLIVYGTNMTVVSANDDKEVCEWWAKALYLG